MQSPHAPAGHRQGVLLLLVVVTLIWGSTFVVIKGAVADLPPNGVMVLRFTVAGLTCMAAGLMAIGLLGLQRRDIG